MRVSTKIILTRTDLLLLSKMNKRTSNRLQILQTRGLRRLRRTTCPMKKLKTLITSSEKMRRRRRSSRRT